MIDFNKVPKKRIVLVCVLLALPYAYFEFSKRAAIDGGSIGTIFHTILYSAGFLFILAFISGVVAAALIIVLFLVLGLARLLLGVSSEMDLIETFGPIGYISIGITLIASYYLLFAGVIKI